ncbi:MAG: acyl-ACP thioesterase [Clostridia bacterium]|nr:acyl-ACP thioesterase [Clostridia bacterium]
MATDNKLIFSKERSIDSAYMDSEVKLGVAQALLMLQDNFTDYFYTLKCDGVRLREIGYFWVFTKMKVKFFKRPNWHEVIDTATFTVKNTRLKTSVNSIFKDKTTGEPLLIANQEACILDLKKHHPVALAKVPYPNEGFPEAIFDEPFGKFGSDDTGYEEIYDHKIRYSQIDMSHHLNNIEYIRLAVNVFSEEFMLTHEVDSLEVHYTGESKEGQTLRIYKAEKEDGTYIRIKESERCVFDMRISFRDK